MATPTVLWESLYLSHSIITETPVVGIHHIQQKSVAKNILKSDIPPKKGLSSWEGAIIQKKNKQTPQ